MILGNRKLEKPGEDFGGLIADEMGLGKSLSMLSAIIMSQKSSKIFKEQGCLLSEEIFSKSAARATLIIVPSECMYYDFSILQVRLTA